MASVACPVKIIPSPDAANGEPLGYYPELIAQLQGRWNRIEMAARCTFNRGEFVQFRRGANRACPGIGHAVGIVPALVDTSKFLLATVAMIVLLVNTSAMCAASSRVPGAAEETLSNVRGYLGARGADGHLGAVQLQLAFAAGAGLPALLTTTSLGVYKPGQDPVLTP